MAEDPLDALRAAIRRRGQHDSASEEERFSALARNYEKAARGLVLMAQEVAARVPELTLTLEDEEETFTSPAFPGRETPVRSQRIKIGLGGDFLILDPTAAALGGAIGQVQVTSSRPIPFLIEKTIYLIRSRDAQEREATYWGYRSAEDRAPSPSRSPATCWSGCCARCSRRSSPGRRAEPALRAERVAVAEQPGEQRGGGRQRAGGGRTGRAGSIRDRHDQGGGRE